MRPLWLSLALLYLTQYGYSQDAPKPSTTDVVGTEFTIFFTENDARRLNKHFDMSLFLSTNLNRTVKVRVSLPLMPFQPVQEVTVNKGSVTEVLLSQDLMHIGAGISNRGILILSDGGISVYGINPQTFSAEGFIAIPNRLLGTDYYAIGMPAETSSSQIGVVATRSGETEVTVSLPNNDDLLSVEYKGRSYGPNDVIVVKLKQFQTLQLQHHNHVKYIPSGDMSGARIQCTQSCAAFSGNSRTSVEGRSRDLLVEQLPPVSTWGTEFAVPPTPERPDRPDVLKIVCQQPGTTAVVDGKPYVCNAGGNIQLKVSTSSPHYVTATKPIMVATVVMSQLSAHSQIQADPAMTLIIPEEQYAQSYTLATAKYSGASTYQNYLTIVIRKDKLDSVVINGENVNTAFPHSNWVDIPNTNAGGREPLVTAYLNITSGTHTIGTIREDTSFMCIIYGAGDRESYAYMGGMRLQVINPACTQSLAQPTDGLDNDCDARIDEEFCDDTDDDGDGSVDEDCRVSNAVIAQQNITVFDGQTASLLWTVYATNITSHQVLQLWKQQPPGLPIMVAEGNATLIMTDLFTNTTRYSLVATEPRLRGMLYVMQVTLTVRDAQTVDPGLYQLTYKSEYGLVSDINRLQVQQSNQYYEIIAQDLESGNVQVASSMNAPPRNLFFREGKDYSLTFQSIGGRHVNELPYRQYLKDVDVTSDFDVIGVDINRVTGSTRGLQRVRTVYELINRLWTADPAYDQTLFHVSNPKITGNFVNARFHVESIVRPSLNCSFSVSEGDNSGTVRCVISDVSDPLTDVFWEFDQQSRLNSPSTQAPYTANHTLSPADPQMFIAVLDGITVDQWSNGVTTRIFKLTFIQSNGYTLSREVPVSIYSYPSEPGVVEGDLVTETDMSVITAEVVGGLPPPTSYMWTEQLDNGTFISYPAGQGWSSAVVTNVRSNPTTTLTVPSVSGIDRRFTLSVTSEDDNDNVLWSSERSWTIPASLTPMQFDTVPGTVKGEMITESGVTMINGQVIGGVPPPNTFSWNDHLDNGTKITHPAGEGRSSAVETNSNTNRSTTLTVTAVSGMERRFTLFASSVADNGTILWYSRKSWTIPASLVPGSVTGSTSEVDSDLILIITLVDGTPAADQFYWALPNGLNITPGNRSTDGGYISSPKVLNADGTHTYTLTLVGGRGYDPQAITFSAMSGEEWNTSYTFNIPAALAVPGTLTGSVTESPDYTSVTLTATLTGGSPTADTFIWTLSDGTVMSPGLNIDGYMASQAQINSDGTVTYTLQLSNGRTDIPQSIRFTASSGDRWNAFYTFTVDGRPAVPGTLTGSVTESPDYTSVTLTATLTGGSPTADTFIWTLSDGTVISPGLNIDGYMASQAQTNSDGTVSYTLQLVNGRTDIPQSIRFSASSGDRWNAFYTFTVDTRPAVPGTLAGSVTESPDYTSVTLTATLTGGSPTAGTFIWTLSDDTVISPGLNIDGFMASQAQINSDGTVSYTLQLVNGRTDIPQSIRFTASSGDRWNAFYTFTVDAAAVPGTLTGSVTESPDYTSVTLTATLTGGSPTADTFTWTLSDGTVISPGLNIDGYMASQAQTNSDGTVTYTLQLSNGRTDIPQSIRFTASSGDRWNAFYTFTVDGRPAVPGTLTGSVTESPDYTSVTLTATLTGGSPTADTFIWTLSDGTVISPGQSVNGLVASDGQINADGTSTYTLQLVNGRTDIPQSIWFTVSSGYEWNAFYTFAVAAKPPAPPSVECSLRNSANLKVGDEMEIVCKVNGSQSTSELIYTNIMQGGTERNISAIDRVPGFRYVQRRNQDDTIEASLFFTIPVDFEDVSTYRFLVSFPGGVTTTFIQLEQPAAVPGTLTGSVTESPDYTSVTLTATLTGGSPAADTFIWTLSDGTVISPGLNIDGFIASQAQTQADGTVTYTLQLVNGRTDIPQSIRFTASSGDRWSAFYTFTVGAQPAALQGADCSLRNSANLKVGDEMEIVCTVNGSQSTPSLIFTNILQGGTERNISAIDRVPGFRYVQRRDQDGTIEASVFLTIPDNFEDVSTYRFLVITDGGVTTTHIQLRPPITGVQNDTVLTQIVRRPIGKLIVGVEGAEVRSQCRAPFSPNSRSGFWSWRRRSLTDNRQLRTISTSDILESPFDLPGRYNATSSYDDTNGIATTVLTINNLHRTDVAEYQCVWSGHGDHVTGRFTLDVIGTAFLIDGIPYDARTLLFRGQTYTALFEFEAFMDRNYTVLVDGEPVADFTSDTRNGTRFDEYANENVNVTAQTTTFQLDPEQVTIIQKAYIKPDGTYEVIGTYVLSISEPPVLTPLGSLSITPQDDSPSLPPGSDLSASPGEETTLRFTVNQQSCNESIIIMVGYMDITSQFTRIRTQVVGDICVITYQGTYTPTPGDDGKTLTVLIGNNVLTTLTFSLTSYGDQKTTTGTIETKEPGVTTAGPGVSTAGPGGPGNPTPDNQVSGMPGYPAGQTWPPGWTGPTPQGSGYTAPDDPGHLGTTPSPTENGEIITTEPGTTTDMKGNNGVPAQPQLFNISETDSCVFGNGGCQHSCVTLEQSERYYCGCEQGYIQSTDGKSCEDIDECSSRMNGGCDYSCENTVGSYKCGCPTGLTLSPNRHSCVDEDECDTNPCLETEVCMNTYGSYLCMSNSTSATCQCTNCCDQTKQEETTSQQGRKKRSVDIQSNILSSDVDGAASLGSTTLLVWLSILSATSLISVLCLMVLLVRKRTTSKVSEE